MPKRKRPPAPAQLPLALDAKYRAPRVLGQGGMGTVYRAIHRELEHPVAIKIMHQDLAANPNLVQRMLHEARTVAKFRSEHVARVLDVGRLPTGAPYIVMEYLDGVDLATLITDAGTLPVTTAVDHVLQCCEAVAEAHAEGVIHRDLKPRNIMIDEDARDHVTIIDFGLARSPAALLPRTTEDADNDDLAPHKKLTEDGVVFGTLAYMAPETAQGMAAVDARSDLYALGVVLYELCTGKHPFDASDPAELFRQHCSLPPPSFAERAPGVPAAPDLERLVLQLLAKSPAERPGSAAEASADIDLFLEARSHEARLVEAKLVGASSIVPASIRPKTRLGIAMAVLAAAMALVLLRALTAS